MATFILTPLDQLLSNAPAPADGMEVHNEKA